MIHILYKFSSTLKLCDACYFNFFLRDAWTNLGDMPQEEAMVKYVEELKKVRHMYRVLNSSLSSLLLFRTSIYFNFGFIMKKSKAWLGDTQKYIVKITGNAFVSLKFCNIYEYIAMKSTFDNMQFHRKKLLCQINTFVALSSSFHGLFYISLDIIKNYEFCFHLILCW